MNTALVVMAIAVLILALGITGLLHWLFRKVAFGLIRLMALLSGEDVDDFR